MDEMIIGLILIGMFLLPICIAAARGTFDNTNERPKQSRHRRRRYEDCEEDYYEDLYDLEYRPSKEFLEFQKWKKETRRIEERFKRQLESEKKYPAKRK